MKFSLSLDRRLFENFCWPILLALLGLCACGLINLYSVSANIHSSGWSLFSRQSVFLASGLVVTAIILLIDYQYLKRFAFHAYFLGLVVLGLVLVVGINVNGATRWLDLGFIRFQPSESVKIIVVLALAAWFAKHDCPNGLGLKELLVPLVIVLIPLGLIHKQPDLGTTLHLLASCIPMLFVFRFKLHIIVAAAVFAALCVVGGIIIAASGAWQIVVDKGVIKPYQVERIKGYLDPESDPSGRSWQIIQSKNAIGGGQLLGRGFMAGSQQKNGFLPEAETDFAFAALAEEWGFVGSMTVLGLFLILLAYSLLIAKRSRDRFGTLVVVGLSSLIFWQVCINVGMVTGLLPVVGIPLPFISYGGTALMAAIVSVALILNVSMRRFMFQDEGVRENPRIWKRDKEEEELAAKAPAPVRKLTTDTPFNPGLYPRHRLPHVRPWAKYLHRNRYI